MMRPDDCWAAHWRLGNRSGGPARGGGARAVGGRSARPQGWDLVSALRPISSEHQIKSGACLRLSVCGEGGGRPSRAMRQARHQEVPASSGRKAFNWIVKNTMDPVEASRNVPQARPLKIPPIGP